ASAVHPASTSTPVTPNPGAPTAARPSMPSQYDGVTCATSRSTSGITSTGIHNPPRMAMPNSTTIVTGCTKSTLPTYPIPTPSTTNGTRASQVPPSTSIQESH